MKSKSISAKWMGAMLGACLLLGAGLAQAVGPVCSPTHGPVDIANSSKVTLTANCNPGVGNYIPATGYSWEVSVPATQAVPNPPFRVITLADVVSPSTATAATLTVNLPVSGMRYRVAATSYPATPPYTGVSGLPSPVMIVDSGAPSCSLFSVAPTISGTAVAITSGASAVLMPDCDAATSIDWYADKPAANTLIPSPSGGMVSPAATTKYYVVGNNDYGSSGSNEVTVIVGAAAPPPLPLSACTSISPSAPSVTLGSNSPSLAATCSNAPTAYVWKVGATTLACTGASCIVPAASLPSAGTYTVTVTANNAGGTGTQAGTAIVTVSTQPLSACSAITPAAMSVTVGSNSPSLAATCSNAPTAYVWKVGTTTLACTGASCTVPAANLLSATTYNVTVTANNAAGTGTQAASATITVSTGTPTACPQTFIAEKVFDFKLSGATQFMTVTRGQASAMKFTTDNSGKTGAVLTAYSSQGPEAHKFMNISTSKCDFNYANLTNGSYCAATSAINVSVAYTLGTAPVLGRCNLKPNTTYYVNIRNENAATARGIDTCKTGINCSFAAALN